MAIESTVALEALTIILVDNFSLPLPLSLLAMGRIPLLGRLGG
jgi:hypothetical protein